jgi:hypothetical protein
MTPELRATAARQGGVFTRRQALQAGASERELKTRTGARGDWAVVRRGTYTPRSRWERLDEDGRYRLRVRAALLTGTTPTVASHCSAAAFLGFPVRPRWRELVHVTRPGVMGGRTEGGVCHHRAAYAAQDVLTVEGVPLLRPARTALDLGRLFGFEDGVVAADAALRLGATREELVRGLEVMRHWPGVTAARAAVAVADGGAQTIGETLLRLLVLELDIGRPETQFVIADGRRRAEVDLRVRRHLFEFDGKVKYLGRELGGVADRPAHEVVWREKQREDFCRNHDGGYGMSRVIWSELFGRARTETLRRLRREYAESQRRYGHLD